jgi:predicted SAM-dependent methyltransferase
VNLNLGGGHFMHPGWKNYDRVTGVDLTSETTLPENLHTIYSSHCFEHLTDETVDRLLSEARRTLSEDGLMVLKIPDFAQVLERWRAGDDAYFKQWGMDKVAGSWAKQHVRDTISARAAMIFCGWWEDEYGDEFTGTRNPNAYHGPALCVDPVFALTLSSDSPHDIAAHFVRHCESWGVKNFNHRNAWSKAELLNLLEKHGFNILSSEKEVIIRRLSATIPTLSDKAGISLYVVCS